MCQPHANTATTTPQRNAAFMSPRCRFYIKLVVHEAKKKEPGTFAGLFSRIELETNQFHRVRVTFTVFPQNVPITVAV